MIDVKRNKVVKKEEPADPRKGLSVEEWIAKETMHDLKLTMGLSLWQDDYTLPMIKLHFGDQVLPLPQHRFIQLMSCLGCEEDLKFAIEMAHIDAVEQRGVTLNKCNFVAMNEEAQKYEAAIGEYLKEIGPYKFIQKSMGFYYDIEMDRYMQDVEEPYPFPIGEEQVHEEWLEWKEKEEEKEKAREEQG